MQVGDLIVERFDEKRLGVVIEKTHEDANWRTVWFIGDDDIALMHIEEIIQWKKL